LRPAIGATVVHLDVVVPKLSAKFHPLLDEVLLRRRHEHLRLRRPVVNVVFIRHACLCLNKSVLDWTFLSVTLITENPIVQKYFAQRKW